jgi:hypothetical protein
LSLDLTAAQGRFLFPSLSAVTTLLAVGWLEWWAPARRSRVTRLVISGLFALTGAVLLFRLGPVHSRPLLAAPPSNARPVESDFGPGLWELVGWEAPQPVMEQAWPVTLYWRAQRELGEERRLAPLLFVHLVDASGEVVARWDGVPTQGRFPPPVWSPDTTVADALRLRISPQAQAGLAQLYVGFYFQEGDQLRRVTVRSATHPTLPGTLLLGPVMLRPARPPDVHPQWTSSAIFGPIRLLGFDLEYADEVAGEVQDGGEVLRLVLYWQAEGEVTTDYTVFAHLVGADGSVAQGDAPPCGGGCPTSLWQTGDVWRDEHVIPVASLSAAGAPYALSIGWYESSTGRRLPAFSPEGRQWEDDRVPLCTLSDWPGGECSP